MAGIQGQPTPTPKDLPSAAPKKSMLDSYALPEGSALEGYAEQAPAPEADQPPQFESPWYTAMLPTAGAIAGGIVGTPADVVSGPGGTIAGAALGGMAGQSLKELIEVNILGRPEGKLSDSVKGVVTKGAEEGATQALGMGIVKGGGKLATAVADSKLAKAAGAKIAEIAEPPLTYVKDFVKNKVADIEKPFLEVILKKTNPLNSEQSGDQVKNLFLQDIQQRFGAATDLAEQYYAKFRGLLPKNVPSPTDAHLQETYYDQFGQLLPKSVNPKNFVETLQAVPSEKLVEKMWDPKNAAALRQLQQELPMVFDHVAKARMNQVLRQASPDGVLDLGSVRRILNKMPASTRELLVSGDEMKLMSQVIDNPRIARLKSLEAIGEEWIAKWSKRAYEVANIGGEIVAPVAKKAVNTAPGQYGVGKVTPPAVSGLANLFGVGAPPQE